jgi:peptidoglycan/LPS O-acetylase OafA/YrhL
LQDFTREAGGARSEHFYGLDVLRAGAALVVVIYHWVHFSDSYLPANAGVELPFTELLRGIYTGGTQAVDLFFTLSGFVFYWLYSDRIRAKGITVLHFAALRFSRLYPLHLLTVLFVAVGQFYLTPRLGHPFVYEQNSVGDFIRHLFFASNWERDYQSFNGPAWSVSVEVFLYGFFFLVCALGIRRWWQLVFLAMTGILAERAGLRGLGHGLFSFFIGGLAFYAFDSLQGKMTRGILNLLVAACIGSWAFVMWLGMVLPPQAYTAIVFPFTVLTIALNDARWSPVLRRIAHVGNISYSTYLLHFPLQLGTVAIFLAFDLDTKLLLTPAALIAFLATLVPLAYLSYAKLERPAQTWLRQRLASSR